MNLTKILCVQVADLAYSRRNTGPLLLSLKPGLAMTI